MNKNVYRFKCSSSILTFKCVFGVFGGVDGEHNELFVGHVSAALGVDGLTSLLGLHLTGHITSSPTSDILNKNVS